MLEGESAVADDELGGAVRAGHRRAGGRVHQEAVHAAVPVLRVDKPWRGFSVDFTDSPVLHQQDSASNHTQDLVSQSHNLLSLYFFSAFLYFT